VVSSAQRSRSGRRLSTQCMLLLLQEEKLLAMKLSSSHIALHTSTLSRSPLGSASLWELDVFSHII
jgi:hypothetical protein